MEYKLAKQLKDAGFPMKVNHWKADPLRYGLSISNFHEFGENGYILPTLSELIEACGDKFGYLVKENDGWSAGMHFKEIIDRTQVFGSTPEEAVANLYLELHK